jgi:SAM-dependent methyltransferase
MTELRSDLSPDARPSFDNLAQLPRRRPSRASAADKHLLYQESVQDTGPEIRFMSDTFRRLTGRRAQSLREDFCGTALLSADWVRSCRKGQRSATGIDICPEVLAWGQHHNVAPLGKRAGQIRLIQQDVRQPMAARHDLIAALNFSYWIFKSRDAMRDYFERARRGLVSDGLLILDAYGGWEASQPVRERRSIGRGVTYVWDQDQIDPITGSVVNHIHFEFRDGSKLRNAFTYEWRLWTLPELQELLTEAGYSEVRVYWDVAEDDDDMEYRHCLASENHPGWLAYLVARR